MATSPEILKLAVAQQRAALVASAAREGFRKRVLARVDVDGLSAPDVEVYLWPDPVGRARRLLVDIVAEGQKALRRPVSFVLTLSGVERPLGAPEERSVVVRVGDTDDRRGEVVRVGDVEWTQVEACPHREVLRLKKDGSPVFHETEPEFCYRMTCACGRARYSKKNSIHQVFACRVCTAEHHARRKALQQYLARRSRVRKRRR